MLELREVVGLVWTTDQPIANIDNTRTIVRLGGKDYDIGTATRSHDGVLGDTIILHAVPLEV